MSRPILPVLNPRRIKRFWLHVAKGEPDACWLWTKVRTQDGYGRVQLAWWGFVAHRVAWVIASGSEIPDDLQVLHRCDNPPCCNPAHLWVGTCADNMHDKKAKGRNCRGETGGNAKLTDAQALDIRRRYASGERQIDLAKEFNVSNSVISRIVLRKTWWHLEARPEDQAAAWRGHGTDSVNSRLTDAAVLDIRARYIPGTGFANRGNGTDLESEFCISHATLIRIINRQRYVHI
jgi:hypothetical protein